jgi:uncharacterized protein YjbJ (UPF0337 family)
MYSMEAPMKHLKFKGVKQTVVVRTGEDDGRNTVVLYRGGKTGLAFRTPDHRVFREAAQQSRERRCGDISVARFRGGDITTRRIAMNADQFKGKWVQFKGEVKKQWGKLTDDDLMQVEGDYDKFVGRVQERYGDKKEEVVRWADDWYAQQGKPRTEGRQAQRPR